PKPADGTAASVEQVFPLSDRLPENLLRFYVHFATPMRRGEAYRHITLLNEKGTAIASPFLEISEELWDAAGQRLTMIINPGRIKRGLKPREDLGPVLEAGHSYILVIEAGWNDAAGQPLPHEFRKTFRAEPAVEQGVAPDQWSIDPPKSRTREPLSIRFPQPLDHALLHRALTINGPDHRPIAGDIAVTDNEC